MPRQEGQKAKILTLLQILQRKTDETHRLSVPELAEALEHEGVPAERKSIYTDIEALRAAGFDIELQRGRGGGYYMPSRSFQLPELKLLVDAVQSSRFITQKKSTALIKKLEGLASEYEATQLQRQVFVSGRAKSMNETAYYNVDTLYAAINGGRLVSFQYVDYDLAGKKKARRGGSAYTVSPWALAWDNNCYYLIAYQDYEEPANIRHFRVDKMQQVALVDAPRRGKKLYDAFDLPSYMSKMFNMFPGRDEKVTLRCENRLAGAMFDRFGTGILPIPEEDGAHFHFTVPVFVSPQFLGWVCGFGTGVEVSAPPSVRADLAALAGHLSDAYSE